MPVPKKRHSNTRTRQRRANWKLKALAFGKCSQCGAPIMPHHACKNCGTYQGRQILKIEAEESKKTSSSQKGGKEKPKS